MRRNGFTLIEIMIVVAIVVMLGTMAVMTVSGRGEKNAKMDVATRIPIMFSNAINASFDQGNAQIISFNLPESISILNSNNNQLERINLSKNLNYQLQSTDGLTTLAAINNFNISQSGSVNSFRLEITNKSGVFILGILVRNIPGVEVGVVYVYRGSWGNTPIRM